MIGTKKSRRLLSTITLAAFLSIGGMAVPSDVSASDVELAKVQASLVAALNDVSDFSTDIGKTALPLRTNAELEAISMECELSQGLYRGDANQTPPICRAIDRPIDEFEGTIFNTAYFDG